MINPRTPFWSFSRQKSVHNLYKTWGPRAEKAKIALQFLVGVCLVFLLLAKVICSVLWKAGLLHNAPPMAEALAEMATLELVAAALAYSAGIELAYTLFTEGPDEAVEPVIMGLAAAMLLGFSKLESIDLVAGCGAFVFVVALGGLFVVRHYFVVPGEDDQMKAGSGPHRTGHDTAPHQPI